MGFDYLKNIEKQLTKFVLDHMNRWIQILFAPFGSLSEINFLDSEPESKKLRKIFEISEDSFRDT